MKYVDEFRDAELGRAVAGEIFLHAWVAGEVRSLSLRDPQLMLLSETELFGTRARQERRRRRAAADPATILRNLQSLEPGAPVVHETYGVGRYLGLELMEIGGQEYVDVYAAKAKADLAETKREAKAASIEMTDDDAPAA